MALSRGTVQEQRQQLAQRILKAAHSKDLTQKSATIFEQRTAFDVACIAKTLICSHSQLLN